MSTADRIDFFISYTKADKAWAEWIAWHLEKAGYTTVLQAWDFRAGGNFVLQMQKATKAKRTIAVLSPDYLTSGFTQPEWAAAFVKDPTGEKGILVPVRVQKCQLEGMLAAIVHIDLVGKSEEAAQKALFEGLAQSPDGTSSRRKPIAPPGFPSEGIQGTVLNTQTPWFPGSLPPIWNVPFPRNPTFTGREDLLKQLEQALTARKPAVLTQALAGLGGVGKTQLALEFAYRHMNAYDIIWWVRSEEPATLAADYARLAHKLSLPEKDAQEQEVIVEAVRQALGRRERWLLLFDNAPRQEALVEYLPRGGQGHVIITSRSPTWDQLAQTLMVETWLRAEAAMFLFKLTGYAVKAETEELAAQIAEALGNLPLALSQAGAYIKATGLALADYLRLFQERRQDLWADEEAPLGYPATVATTWDLAIEQVRAEAPAGEALLKLCAFLAPDHVPKSFLKQIAPFVPETVHQGIDDPLARNRGLRALRRYSLIQVTGNGVSDETLSVHRLVQAVVAGKMDTDEQRTWVDAVHTWILEAWPSDTSNHRIWPECEALLPHSEAVLERAAMLEVKSADVALLANRTGYYLNRRGDVSGAEPHLRRALVMRERMFGTDHPDTLQSANDLATLLELQGKMTDAESLYRRVLAGRERVLGVHHPQTLTSLNNLGLLVKTQGEYVEAESLYRRALTGFERVLGVDHPDTLTSKHNLGSLLRAKGDYAGAKPLLRRALAGRERVLGVDHPDTLASVNNLGFLLDSQGDYAGAEPLYKRALAGFERVLGADHPNTLQSLNNLGLLLIYQGDYSSAEPLLRRALASRERVLGEDHPHTLQSLNNLGYMLRAQGDYAGAESLLRRALAGREHVLGVDHPDTLASLNNFAGLLYDQGDYAGAEPLLRRALASRERVLGEDHPHTLKSLNNLGLLLQAQGDYASAEVFSRRALAGLEKIFGPDHPLTIEARCNMEEVREQLCRNK